MSVKLTNCVTAYHINVCQSCRIVVLADHHISFDRQPCVVLFAVHTLGGFGSELVWKGPAWKGLALHVPISP